MKIKKRKSCLVIFWLCILSVFCVELLAQNYDYHKEEAPAISWNGTQMFDARLLGTGGVSFMASAPFAATINPALLPKTGKFNLAVSLEYMSHEAFQYWGVNQGVEFNPSALADQNTNLSGLALLFPLKKLRLSAGWVIPKLLALPSFDFDYKYWAYTGDFNGRENTFFAAAAIPLGKKLDVGIKVDYIYGKRDLEINEKYKYYKSDGYPVDSFLLIQRTEEHSLTCVVPTVGAALKLSPAWTLGAAFVYPFKGNAERTLTEMFDNQYDPPIVNNQTSKDSFYRPAKIYLGTVFTSSNQANPTGKKITAALETTYVFWSGYEYIYFSEETPRDMRNSLLLAFGLEYGVYQPGIDYFFRAGYRFDPQPVRDPKFTLHTITLGTGLRYGEINTDIGFAYYFGPNNMLSQNHFVLSATLSINL